MSPPTTNSRSAFFDSAACIADWLVSTSSWARAIHSPESFARGAIIRRLPDSASATALLRIAVHSASVRGLISSVPWAVMIVLTDSQMTSAFGSTTDCISSFVSAIGLNGGGGAPQPDVSTSAGNAMANANATFEITALPEGHVLFEASDADRECAGLDRALSIGANEREIVSREAEPHVVGLAGLQRQLDEPLQTL